MSDHEHRDYVVGRGERGTEDFILVRRGPRCLTCWRDGIAVVLHALGWPFDLGMVPVEEDAPDPFPIDDDLIERVAGLYLDSDNERVRLGQSRFIVDSETLADYVDTVRMELDG